MRSSTTSDHKPPTATHTYSPSVPLSVYRELAAELQAAEAMLDSCNAQNQHLAKQNQQLRQEISKAVQSVLHLQQVVDSTGAVNYTYKNYPTPDFRAKLSRPVSGSRPIHRSSRPPLTIQRVEGSSPFQTKEAGSGFSEKVFTEQEEGRYRRRSQSESPSQISSWSLAIAILLIVATAFGAGYLIVRPLLQNR